jgi:hypothetical protein
VNACLICLSLILAAPADPPKASAKAQERLQAMHLEEAEKWQMYLDEGHKTKAELNQKPIYIWANPTRSGGQHGSVFVWTQQGRPAVVGSIFSHPEMERRMICHEFHSLATGALHPEREGAAEKWEPKAAIKMQPLKGTATPEGFAPRRLVQMRSLSREFTAYSIDYLKERWELRLLPQPLYRYEKPEGDVIDGALFSFVTSAGTDPEVIVALEARKVEGGSAWFYRAIRFSDSNLYVQHSGKEVWTSIRDDQNQLHFNPDHTYRLIRDKYVDELPELVTVKKD